MASADVKMAGRVLIVSSGVAPPDARAMVHAMLWVSVNATASGVATNANDASACTIAPSTDGNPRGCVLVALVSVG